METDAQESRFERESREFAEAALDFARLCMLRPEASIVHADDGNRLELGSPPLVIGKYGTKVTIIDYDDIGEVLPVVQHWCRINNVLFEIYSEPDGFHCSFRADRPHAKSFETTLCEDLPGLLLWGCVAVAKTLNRVNVPAFDVSDDK